MKKSVFTLAILVSFAVFAFAHTAYAINIGDKVQDFTLKDMEGRPVSLSDFKGQKVILNFWATWCPPCRGEMPEFEELDRELRSSKEAVLLAVNMTDGRRETKAKVAGFMKKEGYGMRVLLDEKGQAADIFSIRGIPTTAVIDGDGKLRSLVVGATTKSAVMKAVRGIK